MIAVLYDGCSLLLICRGAVIGDGCQYWQKLPVAQLAVLFSWLLQGVCSSRIDE